MWWDGRQFAIFCAESVELNLPLGKRETLLYRHRARKALFPDSSAVEQSTVNRLVASSNLARGASFLKTPFSHPLPKSGLKLSA
jgi:hypothetical protein